MVFGFFVGSECVGSCSDRERSRVECQVIVAAESQRTLGDGVITYILTCYRSEERRVGKEGNQCARIQIGKGRICIAIIHGFIIGSNGDSTWTTSKDIRG